MIVVSSDISLLFMFSHTPLLIFISLFMGMFIMLSIINPHISNRYLHSRFFDSSASSSLSNRTSRWIKDRLVVIPAVWKEISWSNHSHWPLWLRQGLDRFNKNQSRFYDIYLYQRVDSQSRSPYDWPYADNVHEEAGLYLKFIVDFYHDLPEKMLFLHGQPYAHSPHPIEIAQCVRDDVHYVSINTYWISKRPWSVWARDPKDQISLMYKCAVRLLTLFGFDGEHQLNPTGQQRKDDNVISAMCCAQFYVTKERIHHYRYEQWLALYRASLESYCTSELDREKAGERGTKWFGGSFEHLWHVLLGLNAVDMIPPKEKTQTDPCHFFRSSCPHSLCNSSA